MNLDEGILQDTHKLVVAFDIDGTLIYQIGNLEDTPRYDVIQLFRLFERFGCEMVIWSGGGIDYAERWKMKLGLDARVIAKGSIVPDIAIDDCEITLGKVNLRV